MSITVGLDFGTHQTKVCIENAANPAQKIYEFFEFDGFNGQKTVLFPSIVQINLDDTLSYGFIDDTNCKLLSTENIPSFNMPSEALQYLPEKPATIPYPPKPDNTSKSQNSSFKKLVNKINIFTSSRRSHEKWEEECKNIDCKNKAMLSAWEDNRAEIESKNEEIKKEYYAEYLKSLRSKNHKFKELAYRHFKEASFYKNIDWEHEIEPEIISVWYLTYVLFKVQDVFGQDFYTQMGIPTSMQKELTEKQKNTAAKMLIAANHLIEHYVTIENFLKAKYIELLNYTSLPDYSQKDLKEFGINFGFNIMPEAYAGLLSVTQQRKLTKGLHLLVDIGGGTTDIAFFTITENDKPNIHMVSSFNQGLNFIFRKYLYLNPECTIEQIQESFRTTQNGFETPIKIFREKTKDNSMEIILRVKDEFCKKPHGHDINI